MFLISRSLFSQWISVNIGDNYCEDLCFINKDTGFIVGEGRVRKTTDGCLSWQDQIIYLEALKKIQFVDENTGYICGRGGG